MILSDKITEVIINAEYENELFSYKKILDIFKNVVKELPKVGEAKSKPNSEMIYVDDLLKELEDHE